MRAIKLETLLIVAVLALVGQLVWPSAAAWWRRPSAGELGIDRLEPIGALAPEYLVRLPNNYGDKRWPLIVFLHGAGERGNDVDMLRGRGPMLLSLPAVVVAPQCLPGESWRAEDVASFVDQVAGRYAMDRERVYLVGFSMGGYGTWRTAAAHTTTFAAIVPIAGGGDVDQAANLIDVPTWAFHGAEDQVVPVTKSEAMVDAIRAAGGRPKLTMIPAAGHGVCESVCKRADLWNWLLRQRRERDADAD